MHIAHHKDEITFGNCSGCTGFSTSYIIIAENSITITEYNVETNEDIELPYLVYIADDSNSFSADGVNYINFINVAIVLIDQSLNFELQQGIEQVFYKNDVFFEKNITFADEERLYTITYTIQAYDV